jgi:predicted amidophosphoribosyltransferase
MLLGLYEKIFIRKAYERYTDFWFWPNCEYCQNGREESKHHKGICANCGAELPNITKVSFDT